MSTLPSALVDIARRFGALALGEGLNKALRLGAFVYAANALGVSGFGSLNLAIVLATYAMLLTNPGLSEVAVREIARDRIGIADIVRRVLGLRLVLATVAYGALFVTSGLTDELGTTRAAIRLYGLIVFPFAITTEFVFRGLQEIHHIARIKVISGGAYLVVFMWWVRGSDHVVEAALGMLVADTVGIAYIVTVYIGRFGWPSIGIRLAEIVPALKTGLPIGISLLLASMPFMVDTTLLGVFRGVEAVGVYNSASRLVVTLNVASVILGTVLFPAFSRLYRESRDALADLLTATVRLLLIGGPPVLAIGMVLSAPLLLRLYGPEFGGASTTLRLLFASVAFSAVTGVLMPCILACDGQATYLRLLLGSVAVNLLGNLLAIPHLGVNGCAVAMVTSEAMLLVAAAYQVSHQVSPQVFRWVVGAVPAIGVMSLCILALPHRPVAGYCLGVALYGMVVGWLGVVSSNGLAVLSAGRRRPAREDRGQE